MEDKVKALGLEKEHLKRQVLATEEESLRREVSSLRRTLGHLGHPPSASSQQEVGGGHVPKAIDDFIDELLDMSGMSESIGHRDGSAREGVWGALLLQARNPRQTGQ